ncbi:hypothetical protein V1517DRAFT_309925 [Lipomyces orientalis]|uniref:Uncharacterized protein n=1 Tax=Lipomyces orientalis TaxID=1233043 RepID=A0ACC3TJQ3_9ASCO
MASLHYIFNYNADPASKTYNRQVRLSNIQNMTHACAQCPHENSPNDMIDALDTSFGSHYHHDGPYDPATRHCYGQLTNPPIAAISDHMCHPLEEANAEEFTDHRESHILVGHWPGQEFATAGARAVELDKEQRENHQRLRAYRKRRIMSFWLPCLGIGTKF